MLQTFCLVELIGLGLGLQSTHHWHGLPVSGVAGPLAAQGGGQICRPFVLGF